MKTCLYSILIPAVLCASPTSSAAGFGKTPAAAAYTAAGGDSLVYLPLNREVALSARTGSTRSFGREEFDKYPSLDFRNLLTGVIPGLEVVEKSGATGISAASDNAAVNLLARGNAIRYIVDDMPVYITQLQLDPEQIESVTLQRRIAVQRRHPVVITRIVVHLGIVHAVHPLGETVNDAHAPLEPDPHRQRPASAVPGADVKHAVGGRGSELRLVGDVGQQRH